MSNKRNRRTARTEPTPPSGLLPILLAALRGTGIAVLIGALLLLAATALAYAQADPDRLVLPLGLVVAAAIAFLAGWLTVRRARRAALLCGLACAALLLLGSAVLSLIPIDDPTSLTSTLSLGLHAALVPLCIVGACLGRPNKHR